MVLTRLTAQGCRLALGIAILAAVMPVMSHYAAAQAAPTTPVEMLKWSMSKYEQMPTFQADCTWSMTSGNPGGGSDTTKRTLWYAKPNRYKVVTLMQGQFTCNSVSDGTKLLEYTTGMGQPAQGYAAPPSIADAASMMIGHPMFCGSLLYKFFGGPEKYAALVDAAKMPVTFGPPVTLDGQECKTVRFWAMGPTYGKTEMAIGVADGLVHRIRYGSEPLMEMARKMAQSGELQSMMKQAEKQAAQSPALQKQLKKSGATLNTQTMQNALQQIPASTQTTETDIHIAVAQPIDTSVFMTQAPQGQQVQELGGGTEPQPPVAYGKPAPEISVVGVDGVKRHLSQYRGKVVMIDFWATWCPPCRKGLPETQRFYSDYGTKGLAVLTISDEARATVLPFIKQNKYTFPVYLDAGGATSQSYNVAAIPTVVIIDRSGNLAAYKVGLTPREDILAALKKAGLQTQ